MRLFKSQSYKILDDFAEENAYRFILWCQYKQEEVSHRGVGTYMAACVGFATAQSLVYGNLRNGETDQLISRWSVASDRAATSSLALDPVMGMQRFGELAREMNSHLPGRGMDADPVLGIYLERNTQAAGVSRNILGGALVFAIVGFKKCWPGGPAFERPAA